ncbi:hypothetical protein [Xenorhabdus kozodoii]
MQRLSGIFPAGKGLFAQFAELFMLFFCLFKRIFPESLAFTFCRRRAVHQ